MLRQLLRGHVHLIKIVSPPSTYTEAISSRALCTSSRLSTMDKYKEKKKDDVGQSSEVDRAEVVYNRFKSDSFPTQETFSKIYDGITYNQLPVIHIKATSNNTIISATDGNGVVLAIQSAGTVGFRNARRGTNVAAQAAAIELAGEAIRKDIKTARVCLKGIGPGRLPALKAIQLSGVTVVSITDTTPLPHNGNRPKKVRRL